MQEWLDNQETCSILSITPRTLQTYRDNGTIPYTRIGSKIYYRPDDLKRLIPLIADRQKKKEYKSIGG
ncbi:MAG: helix-turn-helix domain-containing protein [Rikenellaceae bacterium]|jgi:DNA-binding transcriptional MerR regulator|nr:helix-turn-helix domain-containing protein [Rikenellaceae bacterium]